MLSRPRGRLHAAQATAARVAGRSEEEEDAAAAACVHRCTCVADADVVWGWGVEIRGVGLGGEREREREKGTWWREKQGAREVRSEGRRMVMTDERERGVGLGWVFLP